MSIEDVAETIRDGGDAGRRGAARLMRHMLAGKGTDESNAAILGWLADKGETDGEIAGMLEVMGQFMTSMKCRYPDAIDMCGTGGDGMQTFNVSTAASFVAAAAGARVAKHGNRSSSGGVGSADIFEMLGTDIEAGPRRAAALLERHRICFLFARRYHPAARHVAGARRMLNRRSVFNVLGPLCNPAGVRRQLVGVSTGEMLERMPRILAERGAGSVMSVTTEDGHDEFTVTSTNRVCTYRAGRFRTASVRPEDVGATRADASEIRVSGRRGSLEAFVGAVSGTAGAAVVQTAALNAAGGLVVAGLADGLQEGFEAATEAIKSGRARALLEGFVRDAGDISVLEGMV